MRRTMSIDKVTTLKADIIELRKEMEQMKSIDMSLIFHTIEISDARATMFHFILICLRLPLDIRLELMMLLQSF